MTDYNYDDIKNIEITLGTWEWHTDKINLCKHISLQGLVNYPMGDDGEYCQSVPIFCNICKKQFIINVAVN